MTTATPSRPMPVRQSSPRPRPHVVAPRAASIDPFRVLRRHIVGIIASLFLGGLLGIGAYLVLDKTYPLYSGQVLFEIQPGVREASKIAMNEMLREEDIERIGRTQLVILMSRDVLKAAVLDPDVQSNTEWFEDFVDEKKRPRIEEAVDDLEDGISTGVLRSTTLFSAGWSTHVAKDVPIVLNAVAKAYMTKRENLDKAVFIQNTELFTIQLNKTNREIDDLNNTIATFMREAGITTRGDPRDTDPAKALQELREEWTKAQTALSIARVNQAQTALKLEGTLDYTYEDTLEAEEDFSVAPLIRAVEELKVDLRVVRDRFPPGSNQVQDAGGRLRAAEDQKHEKIEEIIKRNLNAKLKGYLDECERFARLIEDLGVQQEEQDATLRELAAKHSKLEALEDRRKHLEAARDGDLQLLKEIQLMRLRQDAQRIRIAESSQTPRDLSFPQPEVVVPLGVLLVLALFVGIVFLRELTDQRVKSASDLTVLPGARVLGVIPDLAEDPTDCDTADLVVRRVPNSVLAESYRQAATPLAKALDRAGHQVVVLFGGLPGSGTTTAVGNLAAACAATGRRVIMCDANFRRPRMHEVIGVEADHEGLGDLLAGTTSLEQAIVDLDEGLSVLTAGTPASRVVDRLNTERFDALVAELRSRFDIVFFDAPPAIVAGDAMVLASKVDAAALVVRANQEHRGLVARLINQLADTHCDLVGIVFNRPRGTAGGYFKKNFATMAEYAGKGR